MDIIQKIKLPRVLTAVITPFSEDGKKVDIPSFLNIVEKSLYAGVGIVVFGTTGEVPTLSDEDKEEIIFKIIAKKYNKSNFVIGVGGNNTQECIRNAQIYNALGFENIMITTPYYNKPNQMGLYSHFCAIHDAISANIIMYNVPGRTNVNLLPETIEKICKASPRIIGIKEASGDLSQMIQIKKLVPDLLLYSGDDGLIVPIMSIGGFGVISVLSNVFPDIVHNIINICLTDINKGFKEFIIYNDLIKLLFLEPNPTPIKYLAKKMGLIENETVRLPIVSVQSEKLKTDLEEYSKKIF
jgi:4-hydroxy-tetrahydrodipicolinate synthase